MFRLSAVTVLVSAIAAGALASVPTRAVAAQSRMHRPAAHHAFRRHARQHRPLTVRRSARVPVTRDCDPVPLGGGPIANFVRDVEEVYGHDLPLGPPLPFQPRVFRDF